MAVPIRNCFAYSTFVEASGNAIVGVSSILAWPVNSFPAKSGLLSHLRHSLATSRNVLLRTVILLSLIGLTGLSAAANPDVQKPLVTASGPGLPFAIADFDGDLRPDLASIEAGPNNSGNASYSIQLQLTSSGRQFIQLVAPAGGLSITARDVNGDGTIDLIATDHSPAPPQMKLAETGDFLRAWGGIASLQLSLPAVWTEARKRGYSVTRLAEWLCAAPAKLAGLNKRKGSIAVGCDADLVIWNPEAMFVVDPRALQHRHKITPYAGRELAGVVETTFLRGRKIFDRGEFAASPVGNVLRRGQA